MYIYPCQAKCLALGVHIWRTSGIDRVVSQFDLKKVQEGSFFMTSWCGTHEVHPQWLSKKGWGPPAADLNYRVWYITWSPSTRDSRTGWMWTCSSSHFYTLTYNYSYLHVLVKGGLWNRPVGPVLYHLKRLQCTNACYFICKVDIDWKTYCH